jgi:hypothetical protein
MFDICSPQRVFREISRAEGPFKQAGRLTATSWHTAYCGGYKLGFQLMALLKKS